MNIDIRQAYKLLALILLAIVLWRLQFVVLILLVAFMLTIILLPFVRLLHRYKLPSMLAVLIPLLVFTGILTGLGFYVAPAIAEQLPKFVQEFPLILSNLPLMEAFGIDEQLLADVVRERSADIGSLAIVVGLSILQGLGVLLTVLVLTMYWLRGYDSIKDTMLSYVPSHYQKRVEDVWHRSEIKLSRWFFGQILISTTVGFAVWLSMLAVGIPFAGVLGIIAALLEIIPLIGPVLASVPAILLGLAVSLEVGLIVLLIYIVLQQIESQVLSPLLMGRAVHLHPIMVLTAFLIGTILFGIVGGLLAVPTALLVSATVDSLRGEPIIHKGSHQNPGYLSSGE